MYIKLPSADVVLLTEGNIIGVRYCECHMDPAGSETTTACQYDLYAGTGRISPLTICQCRNVPAPGRRVIAGDVRRGEVGLAHSSGEAGEQPERSRSVERRSRARELEQPHAPDTEPEACHRRLSRVRELLRSSGRKNGLQHCSTC